MSVALITGGTSGLGAALAELLAGRGVRVVTVSRRESATVSGDASHADTVRRAIEHADAIGPITLLVNCAGLGIYGPVGSYDEEKVRRILDANLTAMILFCDALFPRFATDGGTIVNILSTAALAAKPNESVYCAAKWGARGYTDVLKAEARGTKARVIAVAPGGMQTPFWDREREGFMDPHAVARVIADALDAPVNVNAITIER